MTVLGWPPIAHFLYDGAEIINMRDTGATLPLFSFSSQNTSTRRGEEIERTTDDQNLMEWMEHTAMAAS